ncbi:mucin-like glycoprotein [Trypanosoma conorhini]|uniref:Mucin-like glycoprotein n=1 Tax=Trypanosoma conorhini TaxID=83891 RepID=A0A3R7N2K8_9TRYP|nr:mucin-like glycoprotein [Trypanosoma conorhini]RNE99036.1 mucin-like glycoprotein [Trypanosoma conorhini]
MTTLAVRRRAVCALALLALLCGCCAPSVCGANAEGTAGSPGNPPSDVEGKIFLPVDVACGLSEEKLRWRFPGETDWNNCATDASELEGEVARLCDSAAWLYGCWNCTQACAAAGSDAVAFTMKVATYGKSQLYSKSMAAESAAADFSFSGAAGVCALAGVNNTDDGCNDEKLVAAKPPAPAAVRLTGGTEAQQQGRTVEAKSAPQLQEEGRRDTENIAAGAERGNAAGTTAQDPAGPAPQPTVKPPAESAAPVGGVGGQPAHTVEGTKQVDESVPATEVLPKPNAQPQAGGGLAQGGVDGATGQPHAEKGGETAGGVAERQATTEDGSDSTALSQSTAGAETIAGPQPPESKKQTQGAATQSGGHPDIGFSATSGPAAPAGSWAGGTPPVPSAGGGGTAGGQTGEPNEANAENTAEPNAARAPAKSEGKTPAAGSTATSTDNTATTTGGGSGSPAAQSQTASSVAATEAGQREQKEQPAVTTPKQETERSGERGEATQPAAGAAAQAATTTNNSTSAAKAAPGDSDGSSTAAAHSASPLVLLLLLACAAAAAMVAA